MNKFDQDSSNGYAAALDVGDRRIGVAMTSLIARLPAPFATVDRQQIDDVPGWIREFVKNNHISVLVVGIPRDINGNQTEQTNKIKSFIASLEKAIDIPIVTQEEAVTSIEAERRLNERGKPYEKGDIDAEAACIILQDYLNMIGSRSV